MSAGPAGNRRYTPGRPVFSRIDQIDRFDEEKDLLLDQIDLFDEEKDLFDEEKDLFDEEKDLFDEEKDLFDEEKDLFDEEKDLFDEEKDLFIDQIAPSRLPCDGALGLPATTSGCPGRRVVGT